VALERNDVSEERIESIIRVKNQPARNVANNYYQLLVTTDVVPSSLMLSTAMMDEVRSSVTSFLTRATRRHIPEDGILHSYRR
jgi:hypothetical protein